MLERDVSVCVCSGLKKLSLLERDVYVSMSVPVHVCVHIIMTTELSQLERNRVETTNYVGVLA